MSYKPTRREVLAGGIGAGVSLPFLSSGLGALRLREEIEAANAAGNTLVVVQLIRRVVLPHLIQIPGAREGTVPVRILLVLPPVPRPIQGEALALRQRAYPILVHI